MPSTVWFTDLSARPGNSLLDKTGALLRAAGIRERIGRGALTAVKLHFGEKGNTAFIRPIFVRKVVEEIAATVRALASVDAKTSPPAPVSSCCVSCIAASATARATAATPTSAALASA